MRFDLIEARETEVLELLALRLTNREVVDALVISPFTVRRYLDNTSQKLGVRGRRAVVEHAHRPAIPLKWLLCDHVSLRP
jgi:DNA-binding NarL/FixJ family response regulator